MILADLIFLVLVVGLPIAVSVRLFWNSPAGRPFFATYALAVIGSSILFALAAVTLMISSIGSLGPFDGIFALIISAPVAFIVGLIVRRHRPRKVL